MNPRKARLHRRFQLESLEGRIALSGMGGIDDGPHHHRGRDAIEVRRHGADDGANHNANDDKGGVRIRARGADDNLPRHSGRDERAGHDVGDDNLPRHGGKDDGSGHR